MRALACLACLLLAALAHVSAVLSAEASTVTAEDGTRVPPSFYESGPYDVVDAHQARLACRLYEPNGWTDHEEAKAVCSALGASVSRESVGRVLGVLD